MDKADLRLRTSHEADTGPAPLTQPKPNQAEQLHRPNEVCIDLLSDGAGSELPPLMDMPPLPPLPPHC